MWGSFLLGHAADTNFNKLNHLYPCGKLEGAAHFVICVAIARFLLKPVVPKVWVSKRQKIICVNTIQKLAFERLF